MIMTTMNHDAWGVKDFLAYCAQTRPKAQIADYVKRLYQSEYGGSHTLQDEETSLRVLKEEIAGLTEKQKAQSFFDPFGGIFCRMNLSASTLVSPELMNRIFVNSAKEGVPQGAWFRLEEKLRLLWDLCREHGEMFPFTLKELEQYLREYREAGYPPVRHSPEYQEAYTPAYRVVRKVYGRYLELYAAVERCLKEKGRVNMAIDGSSAAGKTEAARMIAQLFDCNVFHTDDFFLPREMRTPERMSAPGGNMHRERFQKEICEPVKAGKPFSYRVFDCSEMELGRRVEVEPKKINIFEGTYSMHPDLREYYDVAVFLSVPPQQQRERILERNGSLMLRRFLDEWIPMENTYFETMKVKEACSLVR